MTEKHPRPTCHICRCSAEGPVRNSRSGGSFWLCRGCGITWELDGSKCYGDPGVVAPASSRRGRVLSARAQLIAKLVNTKGFSQTEATEFLDAFGPLEVERLLAA